MTFAPKSLFFTSEHQRLALARQTYFEDGHLPSGMVNGTVLESWSRCQRQHRNPTERIDFPLVSSSRVHLSLQKNRLLIEAWQAELTEIERTLAATSCSAVLTDASGVLIATTGNSNPQDVITPLAHRIGVNLSEESAGTTAPGLVIRTGRATTVLGGEHFFEGVMPMHCAAAPIRNTQGQVAGVLNISNEGQPFDFDMAALVSLYATSIENRLLITQSGEYLILQFQVNPALIDTPMVGMAGLDANGRVAWMNSTASSLLSKKNPNQSSTDLYAENAFDATLSTLLDMTRFPQPSPIRLSNGLLVWMRARLSFHDGMGSDVVRAPAAASTPDHVITAETPEIPPTAEDSSFHTAHEAPSLRESDNDLIVRTVQACGGNISKAAKQLQVSRGLIYRRLKELEQS